MKFVFVYSIMFFLGSHIPIEPVFNDDINNLNNSDIARRSTAPTIFDENNTELVYSAPNAVKIKIKKKTIFISFHLLG